ncbi:hypothetical protein FJT64_021236 [Amphibalanus amphitrite]|uniref:Uncharacterized protein n=1 Tax=Amphibalanus amphitrite TaxID=1232801 RepID=A0A6A4WYN4_AMPAM|nr:hypothetical protein FJT64_021236 [Amphibalanus amphitrite]
MDSGDVAAVPQASYHIEVSSADGSTPPAESVQSPPPSSGGAARSVVVLRAGSDGGEARGVKYVLTGATARQGAAVGVTPVKSPAVGRPPSGQATSAARARQILKKRHDLSMAEKKYTKMLHPDLNASGAELGDGAQSGSAPVMICEPEPEAGVQQGQARTLFFVAKPPEEAIKEEQDAVQEEAEAPVPQLPDGPAPSTDDPADELGVLRRLARFKLSERYEILPAASLEDAEEIMHRLRVQNLALKTEMVRLATEFERHDDEHGLRSRRGRKKRTTIVAVDRLRELEKIEAGMHTLFTPSQVKTLSRDYKKNSVQWRDEDFRRALGLLEHSNQHTFNYVRKVMNIPLPSIGTLKLRCPSQPELHVRLEAALRERGDMGRSGRRMSGHGAVGDAGDGVGGEHAYPEMQTDDGRQEDDWIAVTPTRGILKRKRSSGGAASARKVTHQDEEVVFMILLISSVDILFAFDTPRLLCSVLRSVSMGLFGGFKVSAFFLALEQYIAVVCALHHFTIMSRWVNRMNALTWFYIFTLASAGLVCDHLGLETIADFDIRVFGTDHQIRGCDWTKIPNAYMVGVQACVSLFSVLTCALLLYTAVQGWRHERRIAKGDVSRQTQRFMLRFKSFKRIIKLLVVFLLIDIIGTAIHIASRSFALPSAFESITNSGRILCLLVEYWAYGVSNTIMRKAMKSFLGLRQRTVEPPVPPSAPEPTPRHIPFGPLVLADLEAASGN